MNKKHTSRTLSQEKKPMSTENHFISTANLTIYLNPLAEAQPRPTAQLVVLLTLETMSLREMGPQLKLPINITNGSMPLQCKTYFSKILAI